MTKLRTKRRRSNTLKDQAHRAVVYSPKHIDLVLDGVVIANFIHTTNPVTGYARILVHWYESPAKGETLAAHHEGITSKHHDALQHILLEGTTGVRTDLFKAVRDALIAQASRPEPSPKDEGQDVTASLIAKLRTDGCDAAADLIEQRRIYGLSKSGQTLKTGDGRDTKTDLSDEIGDGLQYAHKGRLDGSLTEGEADAIHEHLLAAYSVLRGCYD